MELVGIDTLVSGLSTFATGSEVASGGGELLAAVFDEGGTSIKERPGLVTGAAAVFGVAGMKVADEAFHISKAIAKPTADAAQAAVDIAAARADDLAGLSSDAQEALAKAEAEKAKIKGKWDCPILDAASVAHTALQVANGFGEPNKGDCLEKAVLILDTALLQLHYAGDTGEWSGPANAAYANANKQQILDVESLRETDELFRKHLEEQSAEVLDLREVFSYVKATISLAQPVASALNAAGLFNESIIFQTTVATTCLSTDTSHQGIQHQKALENRVSFEAVTADYGALPIDPPSTVKPGTANVTVDSKMLDRKASEHDAVAKLLEESLQSVEASDPLLGRNVKNSHGAVCIASTPAVQKAQDSRAEAAKRLQGVSTALAESVRTGKGMYREADSSGAKPISGSILPA